MEMMLLSLVGCLLNLGPPEVEVLRSLDSGRVWCPGLKGAEGGLGSRGCLKLGLLQDGVPVGEPPKSAEKKTRINKVIKWD